MVRLTNNDPSITGCEAIYCEFSGLSTDEKPTRVEPYAVAQGSLFLESDTGDVYVYTESTETWGKLLTLKEE